MENLSKKELCEINAGSGKYIYGIIWSVIAGIATGGNLEAIKTAGLVGTQQFEYLEIITSIVKRFFA